MRKSVNNWLTQTIKMSSNKNDMKINGMLKCVILSYALSILILFILCSFGTSTVSEIILIHIKCRISTIPANEIIIERKEQIISWFCKQICRNFNWLRMRQLDKLFYKWFSGIQDNKILERQKITKFSKLK